MLGRGHRRRRQVSREAVEARAMARDASAGALAVILRDCAAVERLP